MAILTRSGVPMTEPAKGWALPWGLVLTLALLASAVMASLRWTARTAEPAPWPFVGGVAIRTPNSTKVMAACGP